MNEWVSERKRKTEWPKLTVRGVNEALYVITQLLALASIPFNKLVYTIIFSIITQFSVKKTFFAGFSATFDLHTYVFTFLGLLSTIRPWNGQWRQWEKIVATRHWKCKIEALKNSKT